MEEQIFLLRRGDSSDFLGEAIRYRLNTNYDLTGFRARFQLGPVVKDYPDITSKTIEVVLTKEDTLLLPLGKKEGALKIFDPQGRCKTICIAPVFNIAEMEVSNDDKQNQ